MLESGYVRLYRSLLSWEWYTDTNTKTVFLHLILTANWEPKKWRGITIERGQRVYSRASISRELRMSERSVRTSINHLISTGEVTNLSTPEYSIITIKNYELYQQATSETTNDRPAIDQPSTNDRPQLKKDKESNKDKKAKEEDQGNMSGAVETSPDRKTFIALILNDKTLYPVYEDQIPGWRELYPAVNIEQELRKMAGWLEANPTRRKTSRGISKFINGWLSKTQDRGGNNGFQSQDNWEGVPKL